MSFRTVSFCPVSGRTVTFPVVAAAPTLMLAAAIVVAGPGLADVAPGPRHSAERADGSYDAAAVLRAAAPAGKSADTTSGYVRGRSWSRIGDFDLRAQPPGAFGDDPPIDLEGAGN